MNVQALIGHRIIDPRKVALSIRLIGTLTEHAGMGQGCWARGQRLKKYTIKTIHDSQARLTLLIAVAVEVVGTSLLELSAGLTRPGQRCCYFWPMAARSP
jgi:hypothetical protein